MDEADHGRASGPGAIPWGAAQFGSTFFMITGFHGTHVTFGVIFLLIVARKVWRGDFDHGATRLFHQPEGQLRDRRDHGPLLALRRSGVGFHLCVLLSLVRRAWHMASMQQPVAQGTASDQALSGRLGMAVRPQHLLLPCRLFRVAGDAPMVLILLFMMLKAGLIVAVFMHMAWERLALVYAILCRQRSCSFSWALWSSRRTIPC